MSDTLTLARHEILLHYDSGFLLRQADNHNTRIVLLASYIEHPPALFLATNDGIKSVAGIRQSTKIPTPLIDTHIITAVSRVVESEAIHHRKGLDATTYLYRVDMIYSLESYELKTIARTVST